MRGKRLLQTIRMCMIRTAAGRAEYLKKVFYHVGEGCTVMDRKIPLYPELISLGDNVHIAPHVLLTTHDITHKMLNRKLEREGCGEKALNEKVGCIRIGDNVFIGSGTRILGGVSVGSNCIIGAGSLVIRDIPDNCVAAGVPARVIGSFEDYLERRRQEDSYPPELAPSGEGISEGLVKFLWEGFDRERLQETR